MNKVLRVMAVLGCFAALACSGTGGEPSPSQEQQHLNVAPATLAEAMSELERADRLLADGADEATILLELAQLRTRMDELNGVIARVDMAPEHVVSFYRVDAGNLIVSERSPRGTPSALAELDLTQLSVAELFARLAPTREVPEALLRDPAATLEPLVEAGTPQQELGDDPGKVSGAPQLLPDSGRGEAIGRTQSALTASDGPFFRNNFCPQDGVFFFCNPNHFHGFFAQANGTHSKFNIAPFSGGGAVGINLRIAGTNRGSFAAFMGEVHTIFARSGIHSVRDSGCCFFCACGTHLEVKVEQQRWDVTNAIGKGFHVGGRYVVDRMFLGFK